MADSYQNLMIHQLEKDFAKFYKEMSAKGPTKIQVTVSDDVVVCYQSGYLTETEKLVIQAGFAEKVYTSRFIAMKLCNKHITEICQKVLNKKVKNLFPCYLPEEDLGCLTIFLE